MNNATPALDLLTRRLILAVEGDLRRWLGTPALDHDLVGSLYLRVRTVLEQNPMPDGRASIDELALTIYLTASTWHSSSEPPVDLLAALHQGIARTLLPEPANVPTNARRET